MLLQTTGAAGSGAIEHDPCSLYQELAEGSSVPSLFPWSGVIPHSRFRLSPQIPRRNGLQQHGSVLRTLRKTVPPRNPSLGTAFHRLVADTGGPFSSPPLLRPLISSKPVDRC
ncbi:HEAT repeat-containing protein 5B [Orchesella cincta]|uniref:HEAT repeat-containing protein 5B n=1 Tax=Orchesella cincta TaxID=48709 RepID=A0A1D2M7X9_ORCCI|nr:HEAT repeat-containing protein 5B [Orchesella cincta]